MRPLILLFPALIATHASGQVAMDMPHINERYVLNAAASLLEKELLDPGLLQHSEPLRTYVLDEPHYWLNRVYFRVLLTENKALTEHAPSDSILPLVNIINQALDWGRVVFYSDMGYTGPCDAGDRRHITDSPFILKVDFYYDYPDRTLRSSITGITFEQTDGRLVHIYFPELRWELKRYKVRTSDGLIPCDAWFDQWMLKAHRTTFTPSIGMSTCSNCHPLLEQQGELDALTDLYLLEREIDARKVIRRGTRSLTLYSFARAPEKAYVDFDERGALTHARIKKGTTVLMTAAFTAGKPDGGYRAFHPDGRLKEEGLFQNGLRENDWTNWFPNGNIRSHRSYEAGLLHGVQRVYYPNGTLWLEYGMRNGEYEGVHKTWYEDGTLRSSGTMSQGFVSGEWTYAIRIDKTLKVYLDEHQAVNFPSSSWQDNMITYTVTYRIDPAMTNCMLDKCLRWDYGEEVK